MLRLNPLLISFLVVFTLRSATQIFLNRLNISHLRKHGGTVPDLFRDTVDAEKLQRISAYTVDSARFGIVSTLASQIFFLAILLSGFLPWLVDTIMRLDWGTIPGGLIFFAVFGILSGVFRIPFDLYDTFVIENRYGFNTRTFRLWVADSLKGLALSAALSGALLALLLWLILDGGDLWWFWAWILVGIVELLMLWLYPVILAPLFNKFEPLTDENLAGRITAVLNKAGLRTRGIFQMDASRRSKHTNAYFTGLGKTKRIVLFDTLVRSHEPEEIEAVLAHEAGHWRKRHVLKQLIVAEVLALVGFFVVAQLLHWPLLYRTFGFPQPVPYVGLLLISAIFSPLGFFIQPLAAYLSRRLERQADDFALDLVGTGEPLARALKRLAADNLSNLHPHPLYASFYYSHPPLAERIRRLRE